jgi:hypothetical protein
MTKEKTNKCCTSCSKTKNNVVWYKNGVTGVRDSVCGPCYKKNLHVRRRDMRLSKAKAIAAEEANAAEKPITAEEPVTAKEPVTAEEPLTAGELAEVNAICKTLAAKWAHRASYTIDMVTPIKKRVRCPKCKVAQSLKLEPWTKTSLCVYETCGQLFLIPAGFYM